MNSLAAIVYVELEECSLEQLAKRIGDLDGANLRSQSEGQIGTLDFEVRDNPDRSAPVIEGSSWLRYPLTIEFYQTGLCGDRPDGTQEIGQVLDLLSSGGATYVTSSDLEGSLESSGRNRPLGD